MNRAPALFQLLAAAAVTLAGASCASIITAHPWTEGGNPDGIPFYQSVPYLLVSRGVAPVTPPKPDAPKDPADGKPKPGGGGSADASGTAMLTLTLGHQPPSQESLTQPPVTTESKPPKKKPATTPQPEPRMYSYTYQIVYLPDRRYPLALKASQTLGTSKTQVALVDGWQLASVNQESDAKVAEIIKSLGDAIPSIAKGFIGFTAVPDGETPTPAIFLVPLYAADSSLPAANATTPIWTDH